jgi:phage tail sheath gpL-like
MPDQNTLAAYVGSAVKNAQFQPVANVKPRKIFITGTYDPTILTVVEDEPQRVFSAEQVGAETGFGFMLHRLAQKVFEGSQGIECYYTAQSEAGGAAASAGSIDFTGTAGVLAGTIALYIANDRVAVNVADGVLPAAIVSDLVDAINANDDLPVTAAINVTPEIIDITAKSKGPWGDRISLKFNLQTGDVLPTGVTQVTTPMAGGSGVPDINEVLTALGTGDLANETDLTDHVHGYGQDTTTLDALSTYNGVGNDFIGLYSKTVARPFRSLTGDVTAGSGGLTSLIALGDGRKLDRTNGVIGAPGSASHPEEIAALAIGIMARLNNKRAEETAINQILSGVDVGATGDRWTNDLDTGRDPAVKAGISPTMVKNGVLTLQNVVSFYHPDDVAVTSNAFRSMRNISILQNILDAQKANFEREFWQGYSIVEDRALVVNSVSNQKARDTDDVKADLSTLIELFESNAWIYTASFSLDQLADDPNSVVIRPATNGFDNNIKLLLSGEGAILDTVSEVDTSIAILG